MLELMLSHVQPFATLWTVARQASLSMGFTRQEYWSSLPSPSSGIFLTGIEPTSLMLAALAGGHFTAEPLGKPKFNSRYLYLLLLSSVHGI